MPPGGEAMRSATSFWTIITNRVGRRLAAEDVVQDGAGDVVRHVGYERPRLAGHVGDLDVEEVVLHQASAAGHPRSARAGARPGVVELDRGDLPAGGQQLCSEDADSGSHLDERSPGWTAAASMMRSRTSPSARWFCDRDLRAAR